MLLFCYSNFRPLPHKLSQPELISYKQKAEVLQTSLYDSRYASQSNITRKKSFCHPEAGIIRISYGSHTLTRPYFLQSNLISNQIMTGLL